MNDHNINSNNYCQEPSVFDLINGIRALKDITAPQKSILYSLCSRIGANGMCWPSLTLLMQDSGLKDRGSLIRNLTILSDKGYLKKISGDNQKSNTYTLSVPVDNYRGGSGLNPPGVVGLTHPKRKGENKKENKYTLVADAPLSRKRDGVSPVIKGKGLEVLEYMNQSLGRNFRPAPANMRFIDGRLKDGATVDEMKAVVEMKKKEWGGTDMEKYLRPETLFNATKYESYRGQLSVKPIRQAEAPQIYHTSSAGPRPIADKMSGLLHLAEIRAKYSLRVAPA